MGQTLSFLYEKVYELFGSKELRTVMVGLDNAGKTTILYRLKLGEVNMTVPTVGFNVETVSYKSSKVTVWDVGGQEKIRRLWHHYFSGSNSVIFVVDSNDKARVEEAKMELYNVLKQPTLAGAALLVLANKQDLPGCLTAEDVCTRMDLHGITQRKWYIQACCAKTGDGLFEGLDWLTTNVET